MKVLSFGEILWDVYSDNAYIGGAPLNFAAHIAKHGEQVFMLSALGRDALGDEALKVLQKWGISTEYVAILDDKQTGKCLVTLDDRSVPTYDLLSDVAYDHIPCNKVPDAFDILYFGTLALRSPHNFKALDTLLKTNRFADVFVDVNIRPPFYSKETVCFSVKHATILKISLEELPTVCDLLEMPFAVDYSQFAHALADTYSNLKCIVITLGADGAYALDCAARAEYSCGCAKVEVVSTVGAGDSFSAAFLHQYLQKSDLSFCLEYASKVAGFVVSAFDAVPDYRKEDFV